MAVSNPNAKLTEVKATFGGGNAMSGYIRNGAFVPTNGTTGNISTTVAGLRLSQFRGADKSSAPVMNPPYKTNSVDDTNTLASATLGVSFALNPSGGNGSYSYSAAEVSRTGSFVPSTPTFTGNTVNFYASVNGTLNGQTRSGVIVWRVTCTSNGQSSTVDLTCQYYYTREATCVVVEALVSPVTGKIAGDVGLDDKLLVTDPYSDLLRVNPAGVRKSETHLVECVRFTLINGAYLECSTSAPIPVRDGYYERAENLTIYHQVPFIRKADLAVGNIGQMQWSDVVSVERIGKRAVQLLYVEDQAFWASSDDQHYILHHNAKNIV